MSKVYTLAESDVYHHALDCTALARRAKWRKLVVLTPQRAQGDTWYWGRRRPCALCVHEEPEE